MAASSAAIADIPIRLGWKVQRTAVNIKFSLTIFKECVGNVFRQLADTLLI